MDHEHNQSHEHNHSEIFHSHTPINKMKLAFAMSFLILIIEVAGGLISHSLALLSDAGHVLTDIAAIGLSWYAMKQALKSPSETYTYGYHRAGILAAFINAASLIVIAAIIFWEAVRRFQHPEPVGSTWMFISAGVGLVMNLFLGLGLNKEDNINVKSAVLHMFGDAAASAGVIAGGFVIQFTGWYVVDPILSVLIALLIAFGAGGILRQTVSILMEAIPKGVNINKLAESIRSAEGVRDLHHLHVWSLTSGKNALSCHIILDGNLTVSTSQLILREIEDKLLRLNISHVTIQAEDDNNPHEDAVLCTGPETG